MKHRTCILKKSGLLGLLLALALTFTGCAPIEAGLDAVLDGDRSAAKPVSLEEIPEFSGEPYVELNRNQPEFSEEQKITSSFEKYNPLDELGRCTGAIANIGRDLMPTEKRGSIGMVKPSGWHLVKYDIVSGKYLFNRCHLIGYQLTAENANKENLITGTRFLNVEAMLIFEDMTAEYVKKTGNHVLYRVTPIFEGDELVARGVQMEGWSVEDNGEGICFNVYCYNSQPGIEIDYATGESRLTENTKSAGQAEEAVQGEIRGNRKSKVYHCPGQNAYEDMGDSKNLVVFETEEEAQAAGYRKAKR